MTRLRARPSPGHDRRGRRWVHPRCPSAKRGPPSGGVRGGRGFFATKAGRRRASEQPANTATVPGKETGRVLRGASVGPGRRVGRRDLRQPGRCRERLSRPAVPARGWSRNAAPGRRFVQGLAGAIRVGNLQPSARGCQIWHPNMWAASQAPRVGMAKQRPLPEVPPLLELGKLSLAGELSLPRQLDGGTSHGASGRDPAALGTFQGEENELVWWSEAGAACALLRMLPAKDCSRA
ncbi:uncharacterized protein LOC134549254 [Prinia subflava]|uniref:uncharacterized protein LOC134549254 n=1 Tax=Prinia subflava TaxID=208062 RepID=UPI002FE1750C